MTEVSRVHKFARLGAISIAAIFLLVLLRWVLGDPRENVMTDWTAFDTAADRLVSGETIYRPWDREAEPLPYLYPPFALWLTVPLAFVGFWGSFALSTLTPLAAYITGLCKLAKAQLGDVDRGTGLILCVASGPAIGASLIGQYSGLYVMAVGGAALLYTRDRRVLAGMVLAFLWIKPNIAVVVPFAIVWSRSWRMFRGFSGGTALVLALSLPFGLDQWSGFLSNAQNMAELQEGGLVPVGKMVTVLSSIQTIFGLEAAVGPSVAIWLLIALVLGIAVLMLWTPTKLAASPVRAFASLAIFAVAANPRVYFYDGSLLLMGMYGLWMHAVVGGGKAARRWMPLLAMLVWFGAWGSLFPVLNPIAGPAAGLGLLLAASDSRITSARSVTAVSFGVDASVVSAETSVERAA